MALGRNGFVQPIEGVPGGVPIPVSPTSFTPGAIVQTNADVSVNAGATDPLGAPPAGTLRMTVQNTGPAGTIIRVREVGAPAGSGVILTRYGVAIYGGFGGSIAALEVQEMTGSIATTVAVQFEES